MAKLVPSFEQRLKQMEKKQSTMSEKLNKVDMKTDKANQGVSLLKTNMIMMALTAKKPNGRYLYSYQEIASMYEVSVGTVYNVAQENGLARLMSL